MDDFPTTFAADPAGWLSFFGLCLGLLFSAIFWRRTWVVLRWIGRALRAVLRWVLSIRLTTADRLPSRAVKPVVPVRWDVIKLQGADEHEFVLANYGDGSIARDVQLDIVGGGARLRSAAAWNSVNGGDGGTFKMIIEQDGAWRGLTFGIVWTDENGSRRRASVDVSPR